MLRGYEIQIEIENQCYLNCLHCSSYSMRHSQSILYQKDELAHFWRLFEGPLHIYFSGGEPLAHPDIMSLISNAKETSPNAKVGIFTCGILRDIEPIDIHYAKQLKQYGLDDCYISLYHWNSNKHDLITNQAGSHSITLESAHNLLRAGIDVKAHLVINQYNYEELHETISSALNCGVSQVRILRMVKTGAATDNWDTIGLPYELQNQAIRKIIDNIEHYHGKVTISGFPNETPCRPSPNAIKCQAGIQLLYVTNLKQIYPCACTKNNSNFSLGTVNELARIKAYIDKQKKRKFNEGCLNPILDNESSPELYV